MTQTKEKWRDPFYLNFMGACDGVTYVNKHWITPKVCIGDAESSYERFDIVVNANYPHNYVKHGNIGRKEMTDYKCTLYLVGMCDHDTEDIIPYVEDLIPRLKIKYNEKPSLKILFHCFAGKSRSVSLALAYLVEVIGMNLDDALSLIKEKRPHVDPRPLFIETLRNKYLDK